MNTVRRVSYVFLCIVPFLSFPVVGVRAFRVPGVYQAVGVAYFAAVAIAAWILSAGAIRADVQGRRLLGLAGTLLITPFALVALLWVGLVEKDSDSANLKAVFDGSSPKIVGMERVSGFMEQVGGNTDYIIHPEEILADNFALLVLNEHNVASPEILQKMREVLLRK